MTVDFTKPVLFDVPNNGYMVTLDNGLPYEVLPGDPLRLSILTWMNGQGNVVTPYVPPAPIPLDPAVAAQIQLASLMPYVIDALISQLATTTAKGTQTADAPTDPILQWQALRAQLKGE